MNKIKFILILVLVIIFGYLIKINSSDINNWYQVNFGDRDYLKMVFLNVGQGDATLVEFKNGKQMLVDCSKDKRALYGLGERMWFHDRTIDYLLITHPDLDHYGGCIDLMKRYKINNVIYNGYKRKNNSFWQEFNRQLKKENANLIQIDERRKIKIASTTLEFLYPDHNLSEDPTLPNSDKKDSNNTSIAFKISYGKIDVLMTGDGEEGYEEYLVDKYDEKLQAEIYKMGHHGSAGSSQPFFLKEIQPKVSVASAGKDNNFGHPSRRVIKRLERIGSEVWRTDQQGDIILDIFKNDYEVKTKK